MKHRFNLLLILLAAVLAFSSGPRLQAQCSRCSILTATITGPGEGELIDPFPAFTPEGYEIAKLPPSVNCGEQSLPEGTVRKCFGLIKGKVYGFTFKAMSQGGGGCWGNGTTVTFSGGGGKLFYRYPGQQLWQLACEPCGEYSFTARNFPEFDPDGCYDSEDPAFCGHDDCTRLPGCTCACAQPGSTTITQYPTAYLAGTIGSVSVVEGEAPELPEGARYLGTSFENGVETIIYCDTFSAYSVPWNYKENGDPIDLCFLGVDPTSYVEERIEIPGTTCSCYITALTQTPMLPPEPVTETAEILVWFESSDEEQDLGNGTTSGPSGGGASETYSVASGPPSEVPYAFFFGMGRNADGEGMGQLVLRGSLDDFDPSRASFELLDPFGHSNYDKDHDPAPTIKVRYTNNQTRIDHKVINATTLQLVFTDLVSNSITATHTIEKAASEGLPGLRYTRVRNGKTDTWEYYGISNNGGRAWKEVLPDGRIVEGTDTPQVSTDSTRPWTAQRTEWVLSGSQPILVGSTTSHYRYYGTAGDLMLESITSLANGQTLTTAYDYHVAHDEYGTHLWGKLKCVRYPDGSWTRNIYNPRDGELIHVLRPWLSGVSDPMAATIMNSSATTHELVHYSPEENWEVESILGQVTSRLWRIENVSAGIYSSSDHLNWTAAHRRAVPPASYFSQRVTERMHFGEMTTDPWGTPPASNGSSGPGGTNIVYLPLSPPAYNGDDVFGSYYYFSIQQRFNADYSLWEGKMDLKTGYSYHWLANPVVRSIDSSGRMTAHEFKSGRFNQETKGFEWSGDRGDGYIGGAMNHVETRYAIDPATRQVIAEHPLRHEKWYDYRRQLRHDRLMKGTHVLTETVQDFPEEIEYYGDSHEPYAARKDGVQTFSKSRHSPTETDEVDADGTVTRTTVDEFGEPIYTSKLGHNGSPEIRQGTIEAGLTTIQYRMAVGSPVLARITSSTRDMAGRTIAEVDENGLVTTTSYELGGRRVIQTLPGGQTRITENYLDGRLKSVTGTAVIPEFHEYAVDSDGSISETVYANDSGTGSTRSPRWTKTTTNGLGWVVKTERPGPAANVIAQVHSYNTKGQRVKTTQTGMADTLYVYDVFGELAAQGQDFNANGQLDVNSLDPITTTQRTYEQIGGQWFEVTSTSVFASETSTTPTLVTKQVKRSLGGANEIVITTGTDGTVTSTTTTRQPEQKRVIVMHTSNRTTLPAQQIIENGLLVSETSHASAVPTLHSYDGIERLSTTTDATGITWQMIYDDEPLGSAGLLGQMFLYRDRVKERRIQPAGASEFTLEASYTYHPVTGQLETETNAAGQTTHYDYDALGRKVRQYGPATYPVAYAFSPYGELVQMATFRTDPGTAFTVANGDVTTWRYDPASGVLLGKKDAANAELTYTYHPSGQMHTRTWARGAVTTYSYDLLGQLTQVFYGYNGVTPNVYHTYHRYGGVKTTTDGAGTHTYPQQGLGSTELVETHRYEEPGPGGNATGARITQTLNAQGQRSGWKIEHGVIPAVDASGMANFVSERGYTYTTGGELERVTFGAARWDYAYVPGTSLIDRLTASGSGATVVGQRTYDARRRLQTLGYRASSTLRQGWEHGYDPVHPQRRVKTASLLPGYPGWAHDYNARGEVTGASRGTGNLASLTAVDGQTWGFSYDAIGNRTASTRGVPGDGTGGVRATTYVANELNQYDSIARPNALEVTGVTLPDVPRVAVNGQPPGSGRPPSNGEPGGFALWLDDIAGGAQDGNWPQVDLLVKNPGAGHQGADLQFTRSGRTLVRPSEALVYDADGNLTSDGVFSYTWDGENRLIKAEMKTANVPAEMPLVKIECRYDAQGRRFMKRITRGTYMLERFYWYDGWNVMAETTWNQVINHYVWGTDLSGTMQGAGGVGGLLGVASNSFTTVLNSYKNLALVCGDVNGNVTGLIAASDGALVARYDYDPFGNLVTDWRDPSRRDVPQCPFLFSTKYRDAETGWYYYGFRYYSPEMGRWPSRDPIGEHGGLNLYVMCENNTVNGIDYLGLTLFLDSKGVSRLEMEKTFPGHAGMTGGANGGLAKPKLTDEDIIVEIEGTKNCAYIKKAKTLELRVTVRILNEDAAYETAHPTISFIVPAKVTGYTHNGWRELIGHEARRIDVYDYADKEFLQPIERVGREVAKYGEDNLFYSANGDAKIKLQRYLDKSRNEALKQFSEYVEREQLAIGAESASSNWTTVGGRRDKMRNKHIVRLPKMNWNITP